MCRVGECKTEIVAGSDVVCKQPHRVPVHLKDAVDKEVDRLLESGIIVLSDSVWSSPVVPVRKPSGAVRLCINFKDLSSITPLSRYWLPTLGEILDQAGSSSCLSKLDLTQGFH